MDLNGRTRPLGPATIARGLALAGLALSLLGIPAGRAHAEAGDAYADSIRAWQSARVERLRSKSGWLAVAGLFWLDPGENSIGTGAGNRLVLPAGSAPERIGSLYLDPGPDGGTVTFRATPGAGTRIADSLVTERVLKGDDTGEPDVVEAGRLSLYVIRRGGRVAIRMKDPESPILKSFAGLDYFPIDPRWRVTAEFVPISPPYRIPVPNILGYADSMLVPGHLVFELDGKKCRLLPLREDPADSSLFIIFRDATSGVSTYGGGRFLGAEAPRGNRVVLDFNQAYNPPCALNPYTTCPLPPKGNELDFEVSAGEKAPAGH